jgi:hypothetical protein
LIISLIYFQRGFNQSADEAVFSPGYIVGSELESQDIILSSGNNVTSFQENIDIHIQNGNSARVITGESGEKEVKIADNTMNRLIVPYGKRSKIILSDGTKVWLNSGSILEFPSMFEGSNRTVTISGEMYIEVAEAAEIDGKKLIAVGRLIPELQYSIPDAIENASAHLGKKYDYYYDEANDLFYCSELFRFSFKDSSGNYIIEPLKMSFKNKETGKPDPFWESHFKKLNVDIPEGMPGTNPADMAKLPVIDIVHTFFK